jgi:hypothetical protein
MELEEINYLYFVFVYMACNHSLLDFLIYFLFFYQMLTYGDVLLDEPGDLYGLVCLDPGDALLHQVPALHVQVQRTVLSLHLPR